MSEYKKVYGQNAVIHLPTSRVIYLDNAPTIHSEKYLAWASEGNVAADADIPPPHPPPTQEQIIAQYASAVQQRLDDFAKTRGYDGILSAATYATSLIAKFAAEGQCAVVARDATWAKCGQILAEVQANTRPLPTLIELVAELPLLEWPA